MELLERIRRDLGEHEDPPYVNRSAFVDELNARSGAPLGSPWCASWVGAVLKDLGFKVPGEYAACGNWHAMKRGTAKAGNVVLYNFEGGAVAHHCGLVFGVFGDRIMVAEGNTSMMAYDREGWGVFLKERRLDVRNGILCYVEPEAA